MTSITVNSTNIITINGESAFCYTPMYDETGKFNWENNFTNALNVLGYIPYISIISGFARMYFASIRMNQYEHVNRETYKHYHNHFIRSQTEVIGGGLPIPLIGNIICLWWDVANAALLLKIAIENRMENPSALSTKDIYPI